MTERISSVKILLYLLTCVVIFYAVYYAIGSLVFAIYGLVDFDGRIPFDFEHWIEFSDCCGTLEKVNVVSMLVTFPVCGVIFGFFIPRWVWDFSLTTTIIHGLLSCCAMLNVPRNWTWWVSLGIGCLLMMGCSEGVWHVHNWRQRQRLVVPEQKEGTGYLHG